MYSDDDPPPSFAPGAMSGYDPNELHSNSTVDDYNQLPPSQKDIIHGQGNSYNQLFDQTTDRGLDQSANIYDDNKVPSRTDIRHGQGNSYNQDPNTSRGSVGGGRPWSLSDMTKGNVSGTTSDGGSGSYNNQVKAPSYGDMNQRGVSDTGPSGDAGFDDTPDAKDYEGMSMVAKTFKKFHPNAYYKNEDEDDQY